MLRVGERDLRQVDFEWNEHKDRANRRKHGVSFAEAREIFEGPVPTWVDDRQDYGEERYLPIGALSQTAVIVVAHTRRYGKTRLISARRANRKERTLYHAYLEKTAPRD